MKKFFWDEKTIGAWHKRTMPLTDVSEQRERASLEAKEYFQARLYPEKMEEMADFYIANAALAGRFNDAGGVLVCQLLQNNPYWNEINRAVQCKMAVNMKRTFVRVNGQYQHEEKTDE